MGPPSRGLTTCRRGQGGTWNVTSLVGKEPELVREVEKFRLDIVGLTSTHDKGSGTSLLERAWTLYHSGVADACDLQRSLYRFATACEAAGMKISTSKSEAMVFNRKKVECLLRVKEEILPQVEEFKYLGVLFTMVKIFVPTLTYGHELWVMTERTRSRVQTAEMSFLRRVAGLSLRDRVRSSAIREELGVEPLLLRVEKSQMRWLGHLVRMPPGRLPGEVFRACSSSRRPPGRPRTRWRDYVS
ncbi:hypothetical protein D4764_17G0006400 [Takifugu flavidus]|uniref:Reverse transcriptase domain-containing protein n=1 Tax=Takifugu flavidus TaxID=433684 RepID=A0A5C6NZD5_9TELE|nr:hypothetical protein D4764_17G0006400 [Takifugu flavidus]